MLEGGLGKAFSIISASSRRTSLNVSHMLRNDTRCQQVSSQLDKSMLEWGSNFKQRDTSEDLIP